MKVDKSVLTLEGELTIDHAPQLRQLLLEMVQQHPAGVMVEASRVTGMDVAILQLLVSARLTWEALGGKLTWRARPAVIEKLLEETGLSL
ncbi:MAG: STAS domain-containing protein [Magnetococcales bacterium]|nr:STAS domain-containing protein [Magnetococcales bacterium]NGZ26300.1 STAS domain-containing protein [Magnetococcales bacterium]